jgi:hypothetical protein
MTVGGYLDELVERLRNAFPSEGRQMSMADQGTVYMVCSAWAAENKDLPRQPYDAENERGE